MNTIEDILERRRQAKVAETAAVELRRQLDERLIALLPAGKMEGATTTEVGGAKVTVTRGFTRKVDSAALTARYAGLPLAVQGAFRWSADVDTKRYRELGDADMHVAAEFVTAKPSAPTIKVEYAEAEGVS